MEKILEFTAVPTITVVVYLAARLIRGVFDFEGTRKLLPSVCGVLGLILGLICYFTLPQYIPAENWLMAAACGIVSGFAATGVHQAGHQIKKSPLNTKASDLGTSSTVNSDSDRLVSDK